MWVGPAEVLEYCPPDRADTAAAQRWFHVESPALNDLCVLITDEELEQMAPGFARNLAMGEAVRTWLYDVLEPAAVFQAGPPAK